MANSMYSMDSLRKESVRVYKGMSIIFPQFSKEERINISELTKFNGCYSVNNSTICFVSEDEVYVIPYTDAVICTLHSAGFRQKSFYTPFSNYDYPKLERSKWEALRKKAQNA